MTKILVKNTATRAAIYARKSTEDERTAEDGRSVDRQVALARAFCGRQGWAVATDWVLTDERSGADFTRPGLLRLLAGAEARPRPFDVLVVMNVDRIGRNMFRTGAVVQRLHAAGVAIYTYQDGRRIEFETPTEKLMLGVSGFAAEEYRHSIKLKTTEALRAKAARGHQAAGKTYGYRLVRRGDHTEREIVPEQAKVVRRVFEMSADGHGDMRIVNALSADHVAAPGRGWTKTTVRRILRNRLYVGVQVYGRTQTVDDGGRGKRVRVSDEAQWVTAPVPHLRIVSDALWDKVQRRKEQTKQHYLRAPDGKLMAKPESGLVAAKVLNGIARCGVCGSSMVHMGSGQKNRYYCLQRNRLGPAGCSNRHGAPMRELDEAVLDELYHTLVDKPEVVAELCEARVDRLRREQAGSSQRANAERAIEKIEAEIARLTQALATGRASADVTAAIEERRGRIDAVKAGLQPEPVKFDRAKFYAGIKSITGRWAVTPLLNPSDPVLVRQILRKLGVDKVVVHREPDGRWSWESALDAGRLIYTGSPAPSEKPVFGADLVNTTSGFMDATLL
jgi:site-specific DNA recombinase